MSIWVLFSYSRIKPCERFFVRVGGGDFYKNSNLTAKAPPIQDFYLAGLKVLDAFLGSGGVFQFGVVVGSAHQLAGAFGNDAAADGG